MPLVIFALQLCLFLFALLIALYSWFYKNQVRKTKKELGIVLPTAIERLLSATIFFPIGCAFVMFIFLFLLNIHFW